MTTSIGIDFGGTQLKLAEVDGSRILRELTVDTPAEEGPEAVLNAMVEGVLQLQPAPIAVGLAIPGQVDQHGNCYRLPNVGGFENVNIAGQLAPRLGCPVVVENDGNAAAHGESLFGAGRRFRSFAMLTLGTGVGGGLVIDGRVRTGSHGFAAELGHLQIDSSSDAWACSCGARGCVEAYAGTRALIRKFREAGGCLNGDEHVLPVATAARKGEAAGIAAFEMMAWAIAKCITLLQTALDLDAIVFTGGISRSFDLVENSVREAVSQLAYSAPLGQIPLVLSELGSRAGVVGAANLRSLRSG
jgi:glucokinase